MDKDLVVGVAGAVFLVVAMIAVFTYESNQAAGSGVPFLVQWDDNEDALEGGDENAVEGDECTEVPFALQQTNMTAVSFALTWTDDTGDADTFNVTITSPSGVVQMIEGAEGELILDFDLNPIPDTTQVTATDEANAMSLLAAQDTTRTGAGDWTALVCLTDAPGVNAPVAGLPPVAADGANAFRWDVTYTYYTGRILPQV